MSTQAHPGVSRPRSDEEYAGMDVAHLLMQGGASSQLDPVLTGHERRELEKRLARKRPVGFAPWPD